MNLLDQLYNFGGQLQGLWNNPQTIVAQLQNNHILLVEIIAVAFILLFLLYILLKPSPKPKVKPALQEEEPMPTVQKAQRTSSKAGKKESTLVEPVRQTSVSKTVKAVQEEARLQDMQAKQKQGQEQLLTEDETLALQELSQEEEQALAKAIEEAGQKALAEVAGEPHQAEFFETQGVAEDAVKKIFSGAREEKQAEILNESSAEEVVAPVVASKKVAPKMDFLILYYMAPRSQAYPVADLFKLFDSFGLKFNGDNVFEFVDRQDGLQFYVASALKPGMFVLDPDAQVPGLSFILDLQKVQNGKVAFGKMLQFIDELTRYLKGDVLDERRQRMTTATMNEYLARIKSFQRV